MFASLIRVSNHPANSVKHPCLAMKQNGEQMFARKRGRDDGSVNIVNR